MDESLTFTHRVTVPAALGLCVGGGAPARVDCWTFRLPAGAAGQRLMTKPQAESSTTLAPASAFSNRS